MTIGNIYGYLRVSTDKQDLENQKYEILNYAHENKYKDLIFIEEQVTGRKWWNERKLGEQLNQARAGDIFLFSEISRIARSTLQVLEFLKECSTKNIAVHIIKNKRIIDDSIESKILVMVHSLVAEMERDFISSRTKNALAKKKAEGITLGRPKGKKQETTKILELKPKIRGLLKEKVKKTEIAKMLNISRTSIYSLIANDEELKKLSIK